MRGKPRKVAFPTQAKWAKLEKGVAFFKKKFLSKDIARKPLERTVLPNNDIERQKESREDVIGITAISIHFIFSKASKSS